MGSKDHRSQNGGKTRDKMMRASGPRSRLRTALQARACISVFGLLAAVAATSATAQDADSMQDAPTQVDPPPGFTPAAPGSEGPPLPFPGLSPEQAAAARADLAARDRQAAAAAAAADRAWYALGDPTADPIPPDLPPTKFVPYEVAPRSDVAIPQLAPTHEEYRDRAHRRCCWPGGGFWSPSLPASPESWGSPQNTSRGDALSALHRMRALLHGVFGVDETRRAQLCLWSTAAPTTTSNHHHAVASDHKDTIACLCGGPLIDGGDDLVRARSPAPAAAS